MTRKAEVVDRDRGWKDLMKRARQLAGGASVKVGVLDEGPGAARPEGSGLSVAEIAAVQEFGTEDGHVPARPFVAPTFDRMKTRLRWMARQFAWDILVTGTMDVERALNVLGSTLAAEIKKTVTTGPIIPPPNAPSTLLRKARKGRTAKFFKRAARNIGDALAQAGALSAVRTLVDTGRMVGAITWAVVMGGGGDVDAGGGEE